MATKSKSLINIAGIVAGATLVSKVLGLLRQVAIAIYVKVAAKNQDQAKLTVDHIIPLAIGGTNDLSNLQTLCSSCNGHKYDKAIPDFNPVSVIDFVSDDNSVVDGDRPLMILDKLTCTIKICNVVK